MGLHRNEGNVSSGLLILKNKSYDVIHFISMSYKISPADEPGKAWKLKQTLLPFHRLKKKPDLVFSFYMKKRCARCEKCFTPRSQRKLAMKTQRP
jgi:hypothetical protein